MPVSIDNLRRFVYSWNNRFPIDYWYRQKHRMAFGSVAHRESSFIDQLVEFCEDSMINIKKVDKIVYKPDKGEFLKKRKFTEKEIDDLFEKLGE